MPPWRARHWTGRGRGAGGGGSLKFDRSSLRSFVRQRLKSSLQHMKTPRVGVEGSAHYDDVSGVRDGRDVVEDELGAGSVGADAVSDETRGHAVGEDGGLPETPDEETVEGWSTPSPKTSSNEDVSGMGGAGSPASYLRSATWGERPRVRHIAGPSGASESRDGRGERGDAAAHASCEAPSPCPR